MPRVGAGRLSVEAGFLGAAGGVLEVLADLAYPRVEGADAAQPEVDLLGALSALLDRLHRGELALGRLECRGELDEGALGSGVEVPDLAGDVPVESLLLE